MDVIEVYQKRVNPRAIDRRLLTAGTRTTLGECIGLHFETASAPRDRIIFTFKSLIDGSLPVPVRPFTPSRSNSSMPSQIRAGRASASAHSNRTPRRSRFLMLRQNSP
jgi:hypothetical protein